ncbi:FecCD family ABC transporter permease [Ectobacillus panaciterrae]|uniref:FecCD family ABC transporter permease n=1 Tax=Ectobacillus panaciterrae TaxID=363872 RepID=UPI0003FE0EB6|nr:iron ABC transporter permease [Ectobacillus panaciterrae]
MQRLFTLKLSKNKTGIAYLTAGSFLVAAVLLGISIGTVFVPIDAILRIIGTDILRLPMGNADPMYTSIVLNIRLPRVVLAGLVGASLAIAGAAFQGLLRNPLADPYTLGVSSGASVGAVLTLYFHLALPVVGIYTLPLLSILASFTTILLVVWFARKIDRFMKVETVILTGIIFSSFLGAFISLMIALADEELMQIIGWLLGSVSARGWEYVGIIAPFTVIGSAVMMICARDLDAMSFGEEQARHLGVNVQRKKLLILIAGSILTGAAVSVSGTIGFIGLVIPHLTRRLWGANHKHLLPLSVLTGGGFLVLADLVSRTVIAPTELPIGVITALIGAPAFAAILLRRRRERRG